MADLPIELAGDVAARLARSLDQEGKIPRALDALGPLHDRDVVLIDGEGGLRARQLADLGARVMVVSAKSSASGDTCRDTPPAAPVTRGSPRDLGVPDSSADAIVACWSAFRGPSEPEVAEADRVLRPGGRLLVLHDYGRDDVSALWPETQAEHFAWSRRDGWFLRSGFRIHVIHCWWTFDSIDDARSLLADIAGERGLAVAASLRRPRLSYNVAIYHRTRGDDGTSPAPQAPPETASLEPATL